MKKNLTEIVFILDRSGSMNGLEKDTIGGYNGFLEKQSKLEGDAYISTVLFDHEMTVLHDRVDIKKVELLTEKERRVVELYYYEEMTLKEISRILEVSESRISQLHTKALVKMRKKMGPYMNILIEG